MGDSLGQFSTAANAGTAIMSVDQMKARLAEITAVDSILPNTPENIQWLGLIAELACEGNDKATGIVKGFLRLRAATGGTLSQKMVIVELDSTSETTVKIGAGAGFKEEFRAAFSEENVVRAQLALCAAIGTLAKLPRQSHEVQSDLAL